MNIVISVIVVLIAIGFSIKYLIPNSWKENLWKGSGDTFPASSSGGFFDGFRK